MLMVDIERSWDLLSEAVEEYSRAMSEVARLLERASDFKRRAFSPDISGEWPVAAHFGEQLYKAKAALILECGKELS